MLDDAKENINDRQFGGLPGSSAVLALLEMFHKWFAAFENHDTVIRIIFLDFSKAFDLIDHNILLKDFKDVGVRPALLPWLASYLSDRTQRVKFDVELSNFREVNAGVLQGSKIGPFAFIAKVNKLPNIAVADPMSKKEQVSMFIDDTTLSEILNVAEHTENKTIGNMSASIQRISGFCTNEKMVLNPKKTKEMIIDLRAQRSNIPNISFNERIVERVTSYKLLGTWIDNDFKWITNTEFIIKKGRKRIYYLKVIKKYGAPAHDMLQFYCSVIRSSLEYGDVLWHGSLTNAQSADLERIQKRALRIICSSIGNGGTRPLRPIENGSK
jgi:DNA-directed RNA polymerase subunit H (RpoH/RPB5)